MKGGTPIYVKGFLEANHVSIPEVESSAPGEERVRQQIRDGADGIKIFANSIESNEILTMPLDLAEAIAAEAHRAGKPVFAHVSNDKGIEVAIQSGVDILAHTTPEDQWGPSFRPTHGGGSHGAHPDAHPLGSRIQEEQCLTGRYSKR